MLALQDEWVWDSWYLKEDDSWHCWFLKAPKSIGDPNLRHWHVSHGHATSVDLINWEIQGTCFTPATKGNFDDYTIWTGSTVKGDDDKWHYFYTGTSHAEDGKVQRIGHAISNDLHKWERVDDGLCLVLVGENANHYETNWEERWFDRAMRDPWVMKDPASNGWLMYFTARSSREGEANDTGCIGFAKSNDLYEWKLEAPVFIGGWGQLEVPQVFNYQDKWYCLFCMSSEHQATWHKEENGISGRGNHYLIANHPYGPWELATGPAFDVKQERYASRIVKQDGLKILGFKDGEPNSFGGVIMNPQAVYTDDQQQLYLGN